MEWLTAVKSALEVMENSLLEITGPEDVAKSVHISPMYLQKGFQVITGFTIGEYIRNRRMYLAALDLTNTDMKVIDIALKYGYETPESFTKAFTRFHNASPSDIRRGNGSIKTFLPLKMNIQITGGNSMNYTVKKMFSFKVIGFQREFTYEEAYREIPKFWDEISRKYLDPIWTGKTPSTPAEKAVADCCIGEYGVCIDDLCGGKFRYLIAGKYTGGEVPEEMTVHEFGQMDWAVFDCYGACPDSLQSLNTRIFKEWLPGNPDYEIDGNSNIEWYDSNGNPNDTDYHSAIWIPVKKK